MQKWVVQNPSLEVKELEVESIDNSDTELDQDSNKDSDMNESEEEEKGPKSELKQETLAPIAIKIQSSTRLVTKTPANLKTQITTKK